MPPSPTTSLYTPPPDAAGKLHALPDSPTPMAPLARPPEIPWPTLYARMAREWEPGQHITLVGPNGSGKTHLALCLLELRRYVLVLATKRQDPLVSQLRRDGYVVTGSLEDIQWTADERHGSRPLQERVVFWPQFSEKMTSRQKLTAQAKAMSQAIDWADKTGKWAVLVDETMWMHQNLKLEKELSSMWFQGRTQKLSVLANSQRPSHVPRLAWNQATYFFIWQTQDKRDLESLREISSGFPKEMIEDTVRSLSFERHEALFIDSRKREMARVVAPPR